MPEENRKVDLAKKKSAMIKFKLNTFLNLRSIKTENRVLRRVGCILWALLRGLE